MHFTRPPCGAWTKKLVASHDLEDCRCCFCCLRAFENVQTIPADFGAAKSIVAVGTGNYWPGRATVHVGRDMSWLSPDRTLPSPLAQPTSKMELYMLLKRASIRTSCHVPHMHDKKPERTGSKDCSIPLRWAKPQAMMPAAKAPPPALNSD